MVGGSVAGSTAGWWPSDRDRFPPRFLLPPSLQTHNCIISARLGPSSAPLPANLPSAAFLQSLPLHVPSRPFPRRSAVSVVGPPRLLVSPSASSSLSAVVLWLLLLLMLLSPLTSTSSSPLPITRETNSPLSSSLFHLASSPSISSILHSIHRLLR